MKKRGFTMVEVIIVVAVIAVLASILIPKMSGARNKAALNACKTNLRHIGIGMDMYANDHNGKYVPDSSNRDVGYLVTDGYLKAVPLCPIGNPYLVINYGVGNCPNGTPAVLCWNWTGSNPNGIPHPGIHVNCPFYWPTGHIEETF